MRIKNFTHSILLTICFFIPEMEIKAQVLEADSLALVALYNKIPALANDTTWLHGNVSGWRGISVFQDRVLVLDLTSLNINDSIPKEICQLDALFYLGLNACGLKGLIPGCIVEMHALQNLYLSSNSLTGFEANADFSQMIKMENLSIWYNEFAEMPDFLSIASPSISLVDVRDNHFNFDDLIPLVNRFPNYMYNSQKPLSDVQQFNIYSGDTATFPNFSTLAGGDLNNSYQWKYQEGSSSYLPDSPRLKDTNQPIMRIEGAEVSDSRIYFCEMTNPILPGLFLRSGYIVTNVIPLIPQTINYQSDTFVLCNAPPLQLLASTNAGKVVSFISLNDALATVNPNNTLSVHQPGIVTIRATVSRDTINHAAALDIPIHIIAQVALPVLEINEQLPTGEGGDLQLAVQDISGLSYTWTTPVQTFNTAAVTISPLTSADLGNYEVRVREGSCLRSALSITVDALVYGKLIVYELITPNGDGDNETFYIGNLDPSIHNEVSVFNAVHQVVYNQENYRNDWDAANLPVGTYYYFVKYGEETYKGNLYIKR